MYFTQNPPCPVYYLEVTTTEWTLESIRGTKVNGFQISSGYRGNKPSCILFDQHPGIVINLLPNLTPGPHYSSHSRKSIIQTYSQLLLWRVWGHPLQCCSYSGFILKEWRSTDWRFMLMAQINKGRKKWKQMVVTVTTKVSPWLLSV